jgi:large subunit ribosomal protein L24
MKKFKIKKGDTVVVRAGKSKGSTGRVLNIQKGSNRVIIEGVNKVTRQVKPTAQQQGGTVQKEAGVHISNVALWNEEEKRSFKVGYKQNETGQKVRFDRTSGSIIDK